MRRFAICVAASSMTLALAGCGVLDTNAGPEASATKGDDITVGLLLPDKTNTRYDNFDYPIIKDRIDSLTGGRGKVVYLNAMNDAAKQGAQINQLVDQKVDVIILDSVDSHVIADGVATAKEAGIPVIAYDRLAEGPVDSYVSFDNDMVGEVQASTLLEATGESGSAGIVMMNGSPTDPNAARFKAGSKSLLTGKARVLKSFDTKDWDPNYAEANMVDAIEELGASHIAGVLSANDAMAGGIVKAYEKEGVVDLPPITGQDADLPAIQRIVAGEQYMTVYKAYPREAEAAAEMAVARVQGHNIQFDAVTRDKVDSPTTKNIPAQLLSVVAVTKDNIKATVIADDFYKVSQICTGDYKAACDEMGLH